MDSSSSNLIVEHHDVVVLGGGRAGPGVSPEKKLHGISFAVANATGALARALSEHPDVRDAAQAFELSEPSSSPKTSQGASK